MKIFAILRRRGWRTPEDLKEAAERSAQVGDEQMLDRVRWIRSYALQEEEGSVGTICIYEAVDEDAIHEHAKRADLPVDEIISIADTIVVRPDPETAAT